MNNTIRVNMNGVECSLSWTNLPEVMAYAERQSCKLYLQPPEYIPMYNIMVSTQFINKIVPHLSSIDRLQVKKIVSVGSGIATIELLLLQYFENAEIFLVDKSEITNSPGYVITPDTYISRTNQHGYYNSWDVTTDAIKTSNLDQSRIHFLDPDDSWPDSVDIVMSTGSWCWHYPREVYWDRLMSSLLLGGTLMLDIHNLPDQDVITDISTALGGNPVIKHQVNMNTHPYRTTWAGGANTDNFVYPDKDGIYAGDYSWVRNK